VKFYNTLLNSLSHELRTPITTIIGATDNLQVNADKISESDKKELLTEISIASQRLNQQVENLLNMSRLESGVFQIKKDWVVGLNSYYQAENWEYQASYTSDNTPWFFNGIRIQIFPSKNLKIESWIINGWQSYGKFNSLPGFGGSVTWLSSNSNVKLITNNYYGTDAAGVPKRKRFHSDNSVLMRYVNRPERKGISRMAFSLTADAGAEKGGGVNGFDDSDPLNPAQYFVSAMVYNRVWFYKNHVAWTIGGGYVKNPGRYLVLYPTGQASPLPDPGNPTQTAGAFPFSANPGDPFEGWDVSTNFDFLPTQVTTFRVELVHRRSGIPYFAGHGGVTSQTGLTTSVPDATWRPDLVKSETKVIVALLFRL
jgi:hypothetical protein